jgi:hypothetical protein
VLRSSCSGDSREGSGGPHPWFTPGLELPHFLCGPLRFGAFRAVPSWLDVWDTALSEFRCPAGAMEGGQPSGPRRNEPPPAGGFAGSLAFSWRQKVGFRRFRAAIAQDEQAARRLIAFAEKRGVHEEAAGMSPRGPGQRPRRSGRLF